MKTRRLITLASKSPRRRELLALTDLMFNLRTSKVDETPRPGETPVDFVSRMSQEKAWSATDGPRSGALILAADTIVVSDGQILGKPSSVAAALEMLRRLRGRTHEVYTAITLLDPSSGQMHTDACRTEVPMRDYSDEEMAAYAASGDPLDKAGAYAIQHEEFRPVAGLSGCYANVMGLPLCHLTRILRILGVEPQADVPSNCQKFLQYACPVYRTILADEG